MRFSPPLIEAVLLRRYKRFLVDVRFDDGSEATAHCTNTGRMTGCSEPGSRVLVSREDAPGRKLRYTLRMVRAGRVWVSVDTGAPNAVVADALARGRVPGLDAYDTVRREVRYGAEGRSRIDVLLSDSADRLPPCYVEVKNVTLVRDRVALFPDAVSERGLKHLRELEVEAAAGRRAVLLPFVARADADAFDAAWSIDPDWSAELHAAAAAGVEVLPWRARVGRRGLHLDRPLRWLARGPGARAAS